MTEPTWSEQAIRAHIQVASETLLRSAAEGHDFAPMVIFEDAAGAVSIGLFGDVTARHPLAPQLETIVLAERPNGIVRLWVVMDVYTKSLPADSTEHYEGRARETGRLADGPTASEALSVIEYEVGSGRAALAMRGYTRYDDDPEQPTRIVFGETRIDQMGGVAGGDIYRALRRATGFV